MLADKLFVLCLDLVDTNALHITNDAFSLAKTEMFGA